MVAGQIIQQTIMVSAMLAIIIGLCWYRYRTFTKPAILSYEGAVWLMVRVPGKYGSVSKMLFPQRVRDVRHGHNWLMWEGICVMDILGVFLPGHAMADAPCSVRRSSHLVVGEVEKAQFPKYGSGLFIPFIRPGAEESHLVLLWEGGQRVECVFSRKITYPLVALIES